MVISNHDLLRISRILEGYHEVFYQMWELGRPVEDKTIPTAAVTFDKDGKYINFHFNPDFWNNLSDTERAFVIAHESMHVLLNHGTRIRIGKLNPQIANIAADIVVNGILFDTIHFKKENISIYDEIVTIEKFFPDELPDKNLEHYYNRLLENTIEIPNLWVNDISELPDKSQISEQLTKIVEENNLNIDELEKLSNEEQAGNKSGKDKRVIKAKYIPKKKWESVIKTWVRKRLSDLDDEQWITRNRRLVTLNRELFIPSEREYENDKKNAMSLFFYQDTSGSCVSFAERFFKAASSIPQDRFNMRLFCFDTEVYETSLKSGELYGFGGTYFHILENHIQQLIQQEGIKYPDAVFIITDGYGNNVMPTKPHRWHWFLTANYTNCIPKECNIYNLQDFE